MIVILIAGGVAIIIVLIGVLRRAPRPAAVFPFGPTLAATIILLLYF